MKRLGMCISVIGLVLGSAASSRAYDNHFTVTPGVQAVVMKNLTTGGKTFNSGEVQSTIVPPGLNLSCPAGRFLIAMDAMRPPQIGTVIGRDLNNPGTPDIQSTFGPDPKAAEDRWGTNDDDIVALPNGWVLLLWGFHAFWTPTPKPAWFDITTFGGGASGPPGVRRGTIVYRSEDCGNSFHFVSYIDPAALDDGLCAFPQFGNSLNGGPPPLPYKYLNGGSDGQLAKVSVGGVYLTMDCGGFRQDHSQPGFVLSTYPINRTYILRSADDGDTWTNLGFIAGLSSWRTGIVATLDGTIATASGLSNFVMFTKQAKNGFYNFGARTYPAAVPVGWSDAQVNGEPNPVFTKIDGTRIMASTLLTRVGGSDTVALAYPATVQDSGNKSVDGYALYLFRTSTNQFAQLASIMPLVHAPGHFLMHMVAIEPASGPVLLYWYDVDGNAKTATIRGRFIYQDGSVSADFSPADITPQNNAGNPTPYSFAMTGAWYGDYHTAGGYAYMETAPDGSKTFDYYPMWVQSDGNAYYSHVSLSQTGSTGAEVLHPVWKAPATPVQLGTPQARKNVLTREPPDSAPETPRFSPQQPLRDQVPRN